MRIVVVLVAFLRFRLPRRSVVACSQAASSSFQPGAPTAECGRVQVSLRLLSAGLIAHYRRRSSAGRWPTGCAADTSMAMFIHPSITHWMWSSNGLARNATVSGSGVSWVAPRLRITRQHHKSRWRVFWLAGLPAIPSRLHIVARVCRQRPYIPHSERAQHMSAPPCGDERSRRTWRWRRGHQQRQRARTAGR